MKGKSRKILKWAIIGVGTLALIPLFFFLLVYLGAFGRLYTGEELRNIQSYLASEVHSADGRLLGSYFWQNRSNVEQKHIPRYLTEALISTEDSRFYEHRGVDVKSLFRVFFKTLLMRDRSAGGGSTISQQLAKNLFKRQNHGILSMPVNKLKEAIHAVRFSQVYSQDEILVLYLNTVSVGEDTYGIKNASLRFFSKPPDSLSIQEAAVLVGMLKSPTWYNPRLHPDNALVRRNIVISNMARHNYITAHESDSLQRLPLRLKYRNAGVYGEIAPYFMRHVEELSRSLLDTLKGPGGRKYNLYTDGLKIYTTLDYRMQEHAAAAVKSHMKSLQKQFNRHWAANNRWLKRKLILGTMKSTRRYKKLIKEKVPEKEIYRSFKARLDMEVFDWDGSRSVKFSVFDSLDYYMKLLRAGFLAMEPSTGHVKVWIGGNDYRFFQYDHIKARRQVGSTFKPIVYATALQRGMSPCDYIENDRKVYPQFEGWSPANSDGKYGGKYSLKGALSNSVNVVSAEVILRAGIDNTIQTARRMGISSKLPRVPSLALGVADISLLEMVRAYCTFPSGGKVIDPVCITRIEDARGRVIYRRPKQVEKRAISRQTAHYMNEMLKSVINEGTAARLRTRYGLSGVMAGKTGTTQSAADGWFIGYTPGLVAGAWVGAENPAVHFQSSEYGQGAHMALPIWAMFMQKNRADKHSRHYLNGKFSTGAGIKPMPACEPFREDNLFDKLKDLFRKKTPEERKQKSKPKPREKKKRSWFW